MFRISCVVIAAFGAGCVADGEPRVEAIQGDLIGCDIALCGSNSPQIAELGFWELHLPASLDAPGLANNIGLQVIGFVKGPYTYLPKVYGGRLTARRHSAFPPHDEITIARHELVGGWFALQRGHRQFRMRISEVGELASWAKLSPEAPGIILESYKLDWSELANGIWTDFRDVHTRTTFDSDATRGSNPHAHHTLLFEGDRIDAIKKLDTGIDTSWVNLGVAGSALAKLALTGHTEAARNANTFVTTLSERQAMLKLLVADYCGDGTPFTVAGQPLRWSDDRGTMALDAFEQGPPQPLVLEARWTADGAACLDEPRVDVHWTALGERIFGSDVYDQVRQHCPAQMPPRCADHGFGLGGFHLLSATAPFHPSME